MKFSISPSYGHEKLDSHSINDLVDVFEDRMKGWVFEPASELLGTANGHVAAISILINYFEGIEIYFKGADSKNQSQVFFVEGFKRVFAPTTGNSDEVAKAAKIFYEQARCGFSHDGMFRHKVFFSNVRKEALVFTYPRHTDGTWDTSKPILSIVVNPQRFYECILRHFTQYVAFLRDPNNSEVRGAFQKAVDLKWGLNEPEAFIGFTEEEFQN
ncbi:hypothetical protein WKI13_09150 [Teredinibacter turnerae]|uniref:hypothetical protein n=1 Tax=Teredinibacter turnerae TaxID=2426 RepID=UPI00036EB2FE|nr:hypothetical protein [Teredinibacter turnerae]